MHIHTYLIVISICSFSKMISSQSLSKFMGHLFEVVISGHQFVLRVVFSWSIPSIKECTRSITAQILILKAELIQSLSY